MSLYEKESPVYLQEALDSIYQQTFMPSEIVIVIDGPIPNTLRQVLKFNLEKHADILRIISQSENRGLGVSLAIGLKKCANSLIARMDTDDIMVPDRLQKQLDCFNQDKDLDICGGNIAEFSDVITNINGKRIVPESNQQIREFSKRRNPFNHMTVMFKKEAVLQAGNYQPMRSFEDYYLWARMLSQNAQTYNIQEVLVYARTSNGMYSRRGGLDYLISGLRGRYAVYSSGLGSVFDFLEVSSLHIVISIIPASIRTWIYQKKLRTH